MTKMPRVCLRATSSLIPMILLLILLLHSVALGSPGAAAAWDSPPRSENGLKCDIPFAASLGAAQTDELSFDIAEGEIVSFVVEKIDPSDPGFDPEWRVVQADGIPAVSCELWSTERAVDCGPLPASGSPYRMQIRDANQDGSGTYRVNLQRLTAAEACDELPLLCGAWLWSPINDPTDSDLIDLSLSDEAVITASVYNWDPPGPYFMPEWRLLQGDGSPAVSGGSWTVTSTRSCGPLPGSGSPYRIEVRDVNQDSFGICRVVLDGCAAISAGPGDGPLPASFGLRLNSANPVRSGGSVRVGFVIDTPTTSRITLDVIDASGRLVAPVLDRVVEPGRHRQDWDARGLSSGLYLCRLRAGGSVVVTKLVVVN